MLPLGPPHSPLPSAPAQLVVMDARTPGTSTNPGSQYESELTYLKHSDLPPTMSLSIKLGSLQGTIKQDSITQLLNTPSLKHAGRNQSLPSDLYITLQLYSGNKPVIPIVQSTHKQFKHRANYTWNEHITLPIKYRDLTLDSQLAVTVYDIEGPGKRTVVGGSTLRLFGKKHTLKKGKQRLYLWPNTPADGTVDSETPSKVGLKDEMGRLEKLVKKHERGDLTRMDWLDKLAFRQIEKIHAVSTSDRDVKQLTLGPLGESRWSSGC